MVRPIQPSGQTWRHSADPSSPSPLPDWLVFNDVPESKFCRPRHPNWCRAKLQLQLDRLKPVDPGTMKVEARHNLNAYGVGPRHQRCQQKRLPPDRYAMPLEPKSPIRGRSAPSGGIQTSCLPPSHPVPRQEHSEVQGSMALNREDSTGPLKSETIAQHTPMMQQYLTIKAGYPARWCSTGWGIFTSYSLTTPKRPLAFSTSR